MKRVPYADQIVVLDSNGGITEQGSFATLNSTGGYVSQFSLASPEWKYETRSLPSKGKLEARRQVKTESEVLGTKEFGSGGDLSIYLYYIRTIGWFPTVVFVVAMTGFVFCISFPSTYLLLCPLYMI